MRFAVFAVLVALTSSSCASTAPPAPRALYAQRIGSGAHAVVVLPGLLGSTRYWKGSGFERLAESHTILYVDPLGFGRSRKPKHGYTLNDHLIALHDVMQRNGATSHVTIVGHSFGALLAMQYAASYPEEVDQLFLLGTPLLGGDEARLRLEAMGGFARMYARHPRWTRVICGLHDLTNGALRPLARLNRRVPRAVAEDALLHTWHSLDGTVRGVILPTRTEAVLPRVHARITFVHGRSDLVTPLQRVHEVAQKFGARVLETDNDHRHYEGSATLIVQELKGELSMRKLLVIPALLLVAACASAPPFPPGRDAERYVAAHPQLDRNIAAAVLAGEIVIGMSANDVRAAGGSPGARFPYPNASREAWLVPTAKLQLGHYRYHNTTLVRLMFERGHVIAVQRID